MGMKFSPSRLFTGMLLLAGCGLAAALAVFAFLGADRAYVVQEGIFRDRFRRFDGMIEQAALRHGVSPSLIKAVIWRETRFKPDVAGSRGERGLMQITEAAAKDWVDAEKIEKVAARLKPFIDRYGDKVPDANEVCPAYQSVLPRYREWLPRSQTLCHETACMTPNCRRGSERIVATVRIHLMLLNVRSQGVQHQGACVLPGASSC